MPYDEPVRVTTLTFLKLCPEVWTKVCYETDMCTRDFPLSCVGYKKHSIAGCASVIRLKFIGDYSHLSTVMEGSNGMDN